MQSSAGSPLDPPPFRPHLTQVDAILASLTDIDVLLAPSGTAPSGTEAEKAAKVALRSALADGALSARFAALDALLAANPSGWLVGDSLTVADLALYGRVGSFVAGACAGGGRRRRRPL